ncbi:MAG: right-handed parallel beta-helix repeat-containing protein [Promethearchaeota archaeon]
MRNKTHRIIIALVIIIAILSVKNYIIFNDQENMKEVMKNNQKDNFRNLKKSGFWPNCSRIHIKNDNWSESSLDWIQVNNGTQDNPHIIENVTIDAGGLGSAILIENSSAFFIIRNCTLTNSGSGNNAGIFLNHTSNGYLVDNNCSNNNHGICLHDKCINNILLNNTANNNDNHGIKLEINCTDNTILGNIVSYNMARGIVLAQNCNNNSILENEVNNNDDRGMALSNHSNNNTISGNTVNDNNYGISLSSQSNNNTISGNIANDNYYVGIYFYRCNNNTISRNSVNNNRWWGIALDEYCYNNTISGNNATNQDYGIYIFYYCDHNTAFGNTATNNDYGIYIYYYCDDNIVLNNTFEKNFYGIRINYYSNNNSVLENIVSNNSYGVEVYYDCDDNSILDNTINNNKEAGIHLQYESYNNMISGNKINNNSNSGISIEGRDCDNTTIIGNTLNNNYYGIYLENVYRIKLSDNNMNGCGLMVDGSFDQLSSLMIYPNNTVNQRSIYYYVNKNGLDEINFTGGGQILLFYCNNSVISNLNTSHTSIGIYLYRTNNVTISNNVINNNSLHGIYLYDSNNVTISNNVINNNSQHGVYLVENCDNNTIQDNYLYYNLNWAISISSANCDNNTIERNVLVSNNGKFIEDLGNNTIIKLHYISNMPPSILIEVISESFTTTEFTVIIKISCEIIGLKISNPYIQMWWNGNKVPSNNIAELGNGLYNISLTPIIIKQGEAAILLNMTISALYHLETYFEMYIAVEPSEIGKFLQVEITEHFYSTQQFNFTFFIFNENGQGIDTATIQMWWNGIDVSADIENLGNGYYFVSLDAIPVAPGEDPILLNMIISISGYEDKHFETYIAVDPASLLKEKGKPSDGFPLVLTIIISTIGAGAIIGLISIYWLRKRNIAS